jgi:3,4-dihydroxy 2-butanone 4-phosphate synthase/GTP cyclohydrolase II
MFRVLNTEGYGVIVFINQQSESFNLLKRLKGLKENQEKGLMRAPKIEMDAKDFGIGAQILHDLNISKLRIMTNSTQTKRVGIIGYGLEIVEYVPY